MKNIYFLFCMTFVSLIFVSCTKDDSSPRPSVIPEKPAPGPIPGPPPQAKKIPACSERLVRKIGNEYSREPLSLVDFDCRAIAEEFKVDTECANAKPDVFTKAIYDTNDFRKKCDPVAKELQDLAARGEVDGVTCENENSDSCRDCSELIRQGSGFLDVVERHADSWNNQFLQKEYREMALGYCDRISSISAAPEFFCYGWNPQNRKAEHYDLKKIVGACDVFKAIHGK